MSGRETFAAWLDEADPPLAHDEYMFQAMDFTEIWLGTPYGPALCQLPRKNTGIA